MKYHLLPNGTRRNFSFSPLEIDIWPFCLESNQIVWRWTVANTQARPAIFVANGQEATEEEAKQTAEVEARNYLHPIPKEYVFCKPSKDQAAHTPTPWTHSAQNGYPRHCVAAQVFGPDERALAVIDPTPNPTEATANAAFIVRACNNHAPLVAMLEYVTASAEAMNRTLTMICAASPETEAMIAEARATLAAAAKGD